jgi:hypothetical protein
MKRITGLAAAWVAGTLVAIVIAAAAVGSVRSEVTDAPSALGASSIAEVTTTSVPDTEEEPTSTTSTTSTTLSPPETTTTTVDETDDTETTTTTEVVDTETHSTSTTTAPPVTTTTSASYTKTYGTEAGLPGEVTIIVSGESVTFGGASPLPGWTVELEDSGPEQVDVHFERNEDDGEKIEFKAEIEDGELDVKISEED